VVAVIVHGKGGEFAIDIGINNRQADIVVIVRNTGGDYHRIFRGGRLGELGGGRNNRRHGFGDCFVDQGPVIIAPGRGNDIANHHRRNTGTKEVGSRCAVLCRIRVVSGYGDAV